MLQSVIIAITLTPLIFCFLLQFVKTQSIKDFYDELIFGPETMKQDGDSDGKPKEEETAAFEGTPVTKETFNKWWPKFLAEHPELQIKHVEVKKLTGKQLFEKDREGRMARSDEAVAVEQIDESGNAAAIREIEEEEAHERENAERISHITLNCTLEAEDGTNE